MSNSLGNVVLHKVSCLPNSADAQSRLSHRRESTSAALSLSKSDRKSLCRQKPQLLPNKFLENAVVKASFDPKLSPGALRSRVSTVPRAALAADPTSEQLSGKFNLEGDSLLQINVSTSRTGFLQVDILVTNSNDLILHWGALCDNQKNWMFPSYRPDGTKVYKNRALRTPFVKNGSNCSLTLKIEEPEIQAIEFLILDESKNKWFKNDGQNFYMLLPPRGNSRPSNYASKDQHVSLPEDLVQIQAYLRWERNGKQNYNPAQEKEEYELARSELLDELRQGTSVDELRIRLTKKPGTDKKESRIEGKGIPNDLVQVQAYIRWEKAGKPTYSSEKQMMEFEEAKRELQAELDKGFSVDDIRGKIMKGDIQTKVAKQLRKKKYFSRERIQRKNREIMHYLNKYPPSIDDEKYYAPPKAVSSLDVYTEEKVKHDEVLVLNKKMYKLDDKELLVLVTKSETKTKVHFATDDNRPLVLHWALSRNPGEWTSPPSSILPLHSVLVDNSCDTPFTKISKDPSYLVQVVDIEIDDIDFHGIPFVLNADGYWIKNNGSDFYVELFSGSAERKDAGDGKGTAKIFLDKIADLENDAQKSLMHRFNIAADLMEAATKAGELGLAGLLVWMRFMATRQLVWNKNYNVKPREISKAQDRLTSLLENSYERYPHNREILRMIMATVGRGGEGDVGQRIRDEILVIQRNNDCKGGMMEEWHQKLHNNTSPDDVVICQALIDFVNSDFNIDVYWSTLKSNGITKERLLSYDRAIHSEPSFRKDQKEGLLRDLANYMRTLKAVHSGADLESAIATCMGYKSEGEGFMVGVQINPIRGLPSGFPEILEFILDHVEDKDTEPILEGLLEARAELRPLLLMPHERLKDLIFLDIALDSTVRTVIERGYEELSTASPEKSMYFIILLLENLALSSDDNEDLLYCLKGWYHAIEILRNKDDNWALFAKSSLDRTRLALSGKAEKYQNILQPSAEYLGLLLSIEQWAINIFTEEIIRAGSAASLSTLLNRLDPTLRKVANLGSWQVISPVEVAGYIVTVDELIAVQNNSYENPTILVANRVKGEEEIPDGTVAVLTPDMPDVLSHVSVRARNGKICFATCFDPTILISLREKEGKLFRLKPTSSEIIYSEIKENDLFSTKSVFRHEDHGSPAITLKRKEFRGRYAISAHEFSPEMVGAKSRNISYLKGKVPSWVGIPTSVALPFGAFEKVLSDVSNKAVSDKLLVLNERLGDGEFSVLGEIRKTVLELSAPPELVLELQKEMQQSGMPWPGDEGQNRWEQAWMAIKKVWASKWNERAYFSTRKVKLDHDYLSMAVLVQQIISADYAFVIHTTNPSSGDSSEIYAEVVRGLGETLVGAYPGRALSFTCKKSDLNNPLVLGYPSKPIGLFIRPSLIFRSDSNGEDLEGYAGAGLYDSVPMDEEERVVLDYATDPLILDAKFRNSMLTNIAQAGCAIEELYGSPQDIEGVVKDGKIFVVQTRPQM